MLGEGALGTLGGYLEFFGLQVPKGVLLRRQSVLSVTTDKYYN